MITDVGEQLPTDKCSKSKIASTLNIYNLHYTIVEMPLYKRKLPSFLFRKTNNFCIKIEERT